jgi:hypothetical protein
MDLQASSEAIRSVTSRERHLNSHPNWILTQPTCYLLDPSSSFLSPHCTIGFPCGPVSLPSYPYIADRFNWLLSLQLVAHVGSSLADYSNLKAEAIQSSETSVHTRTTRRHNLENGFLHSHRRENLKSYMYERIICFNHFNATHEMSCLGTMVIFVRIHFISETVVKVNIFSSPLINTNYTVQRKYFNRIIFF